MKKKHQVDEKERKHFAHSNCRVRNHPKQITKHHVPPKVPDTIPRMIIRKERRHHEAYHLLFGAPASYKDACAILLRDWFPFDKPPNL